jgi:hypothetical protein
MPPGARRTANNLPPASDLFRFSDAMRRDPAVQAWFARGDTMRGFALPWFERMRACGPDVRELIHDGCPTVCVDDAAFAYVGAFTSHVNVGFFQGASLRDPAELLQGTGQRMRHVKLRWGEPVNETALHALILAAYRDMRQRVRR